MQLFIQWAKKTTSIWQRIGILVIGALIFPILIPVFLIFILTRIDEVIGVDFIIFSQTGFIIGAILIIIGGIVALWTIAAHITFASGTPFPMMPTKKLLTNGPFAMCRNPMTFGTLVAYIGLSIMIGSITSIVIIIVMGILLILYIKNIEEKELEMRFGNEYVKYKANTAFIIPDVIRLFRK
jgi:protein-S-isoprenylcysteine O-methyltransferase Ste14